MALEDSLDGALRRERSQLTTCQLQPDRLCTDPRETRAPRTVRFKFLADGEYLVNHVLRYGSMLPFRGSIGSGGPPILQRQTAAATWQASLYCEPPAPGWP